MQRYGFVNVCQRLARTAFPENHHTCLKKPRNVDGETGVNESKTSTGKPPGVVLTLDLWI